MKFLNLTAILLAAAPLGPAIAQAPAPADPRDVVPDKMPFATPYGAPISLQKAEAVAQAAAAEATKRGWTLDIAVVDSGANLVTFKRMDGAQLASIEVSQHKARAAVQFRRNTKALEDALLKGGATFLLTVDGAIAVRGGIPLIEDGKIIGAIGCSGAAASQDDTICTAGAALINK